MRSLRLLYNNINRIPDNVFQDLNLLSSLGESVFYMYIKIYIYAKWRQSQGFNLPVIIASKKNLIIKIFPRYLHKTTTHFNGLNE